MSDDRIEVVKFESHDPEFLLQCIGREFPELHWNNYRYIDEGWDHEVVILDEKVVFRFPNDAEYLELLQNEIPVLERLLPQLDIAMPQYQYIAPDGRFAGYPMVAGDTLRKDYFDRLPPSDRTSIAAQLAGFLSTLHMLLANGQDFSMVPASEMAEYQKDLHQQTQQYLPATLTPEDFAVVRNVVAETDGLLLRSLPKVFLHGDVYSRHLLWDKPAQKLGVIDFSDMNIGDPAFDFAELYEYGDEFVGQVYSQYAGPKDDDFLQRAWTYQRWVGVFMLVDHFVYHKTSFEEARETFDRVKHRSSVQ